jgi:hypothetical protein
VLEKRTRYGGSKYSARKRYALWEKHILQPLLLVARKLSPEPRSVEDDVPREVEHPSLWYFPLASFGHTSSNYLR